MNPEKIEKDLKRLFPKEYWIDINETLVRFGQNRKKSDQDEIIKNILKV